MINLDFILNRLGRNVPMEQRETAPMHVKSNGAWYIIPEEMFKTKRGKELLREIANAPDLTKPLSERPDDLKRAQERARVRASQQNGGQDQTTTPDTTQTE